MDNLSDRLEKLRIFLCNENTSNINDDQHPIDDPVRAVLVALKQNEGI